MSKKNYYIIEKNLDKVKKNIPTNFLDPNTIKQVLSKLKGYNPKIYKPYEESERNILYRKEKPKVALLEIISFEKLTHREIMGSIYNLNIEEEIFGDIVINNNHYYVYVIDKYLNIVFDSFKEIGRKHVKIKKVPLSTLKEYKRSYERIEIITSSLRIDNIISRLTHTNRDSIKDFFTKNHVYINYEICHKSSYILKKEDTFSIRKYGKYKFNGIIKNTKKGGYIVECLKYTES